MTDTTEYKPEELTELLCDEPEQFLKFLENNLHVEDIQVWLNDQTQEETFFSPGLHILFMLVGTMVRPNNRMFGYGYAINQSLGIKIAEKLFALQPDLSLMDSYNDDLRGLIENSTGCGTERTNNNAFIEFMLQHL